MNRPDFEDYKWKYKTQWSYDVARYITNIEEYCDKLEKTLDKAYKELELSNKQLVELDRSFLPMTKEQWKEYLLKDEKRN